MAHPPSMAFQVTISCDDILLKHSPSALFAPTVCVHENKASPHEDIRLATTSNDILMNTTAALFRCKYAGMSIQHLHNGVLEDGGDIHQFLGFWICGVVDFVLLIFWLVLQV